jgi:glycosyltransferase involved in cell wall biosynthesis
MTSVSVVTVTLNNAAGLRETLSSLANLQTRPIEVVIVDGGSTDSTAAVVDAYRDTLDVRYSSEPDGGIYDAMNKGHRVVRGSLVHYLNAGDTVFGEPYRDIAGPGLLPVHLHDETGRFFFEDFVRYGGRAYCHQGILFPAGHADYDCSYRLAADLDLMIACFPRGLLELPMSSSGGVRFDLGGVSSRSRRLQAREFRAIFYRRLPWPEALRLHAGMLLKDLVPRGARRLLIKLMHGRHATPRSAPCN